MNEMGKQILVDFIEMMVILYYNVWLEKCFLKIRRGLVRPRTRQCHPWDLIKSNRIWLFNPFAFSVRRFIIKQN